MELECKRIEQLFRNLASAETSRFPLKGQLLVAPSECGVYVILNQRRKVVHVGRTPRAKGGIAQRLRNHLHSNSSFTRHYLDGNGDKLRGKYSYKYLVVADTRQRALLEAYAIAHLCPAHLGLSERSTQSLLESST